MRPARRNVLGRARVPRTPGLMNKAEARYALELTKQRQDGVISDWAYEPEKLRLADKTFYTPDFRVILPDGCVEFHEVKVYWKRAGRVGWEDDARVKIKVAAELHPYVFVAVWLGANGYEYEYIGSPAPGATP